MAIVAPRPAPRSVRVGLAEGRTARLGPLCDGETSPLLAVFGGLSVPSRASRYLVAMPRLPGPLVRSLSTTDGRARVAWLASVHHRPAGVARYVVSDEDPCAADVALEVVDDQQRRGVGTALLDAITTVAAANGVRRLRATVQPQNTASVRLLSRLGIPLGYAGGVLEGSGPFRLLDPPRVDRRTVLALARTGPTARCA